MKKKTALIISLSIIFLTMLVLYFLIFFDKRKSYDKYSELVPYINEDNKIQGALYNLSFVDEQTIILDFEAYNTTTKESTFFSKKEFPVEIDNISYIIELQNNLPSPMTLRLSFEETQRNLLTTKFEFKEINISRREISQERINNALDNILASVTEFSFIEKTNPEDIPVLVNLENEKIFTCTIHQNYYISLLSILEKFPNDEKVKDLLKDPLSINNCKDTDTQKKYYEKNSYPIYRLNTLYEDTGNSIYRTLRDKYTGELDNIDWSSRNIQYQKEDLLGSINLSELSIDKIDTEDTLPIYNIASLPLDILSAYQTTKDSKYLAEIDGTKDILSDYIIQSGDMNYLTLCNLANTSKIISEELNDDYYTQLYTKISNDFKLNQAKIAEMNNKNPFFGIFCINALDYNWQKTLTDRYLLLNITNTDTQNGLWINGVYNITANDILIKNLLDEKE